MMNGKQKMTFTREERYIVLKNKDINNFLSEEQLMNLDDVLRTIEYYRGFRGPVQCVVVEHDWPEYELVWKMIEDRITNES